jgi:microcystin-dependent protein
MPWQGSAGSKTFGRTDGTRTGSSTWQQADAASVDIISTDHDTHDQDVADGINTALCKDGGNTATADIPMGAFKFTNLGAGTARTNSIRLGQVQDSSATYYPTVGGTADAITLTGAAAAITAYAAGQTFFFIAGATNTGAVTVNVDSVGVKSITGPAGTALTAGHIVVGATYRMTYDGTQFQISTSAGAATAFSVGTMMAWPTATVPTGWLECYGQEISTTTYAALYAVIGTLYNTGGESGTFRLPDMRGRVIAGEDDMGGTSANRLTGITNGVNGDTLALAGGLESTTIAQANLPVANLSHSLSVSTTITNGAFVVRGSGFTTINVDTNEPDAVAVSSSGLAAETLSLGSGTVSGTVALGGSGTAINNVQPTIVLKWIILALPAAALPAYGGGVPAASGYTVSPRCLHTGSNPATAAADGTNLDAVVTEMYVAEVFIPSNVTLTGVAPFWGAATNGNAKVALFNSSGTRVALSASTDVSGHTTDSYARIAFSATYAAVGPATYYVGIICDDATHDLNTHVVGNFGAGKIESLVYATEAGYATITPPTTFTTGLGPIATLY